jgi:DNA adenine methylase
MVSSIVKWAGGKKNLVNEILEIIEKRSLKGFRYIDLFCGGLSIPTELMKSNIYEHDISFILNDINSSLIFTYETIQKYPIELINYLERFNCKRYNTATEYNEIRRIFNIEKKQKDMSIEHAARFIFLNKRGYNGLYRENSNGDFNVPYRYSTSDIYDTDVLLELHSYFNLYDIQFTNSCYDNLNISYTPNDIVYLDPPYFKTCSSSFTSYHSSGFTSHDQMKLCKFIYNLDANDVSFITSNSPCQEIMKMYHKFPMKTYNIHRSMRDSSNLKQIKTTCPNEILISNIKFM